MRQFKSSRGVRHDYYYDGDRLIAETIGDDKYILYYYDETDSIYSFRYYNGTSSSKYYLFKNLQGDVIEIRDNHNGKVATYKYDPYGNIISITDSSGTAITDTTHIAYINPIRYRSYYYDVETGFYYLQSRYYDPAIGRFISADTLLIVNPAIYGLNLFAYCANNPVMYSDPSGNEPIWEILGFEYDGSAGDFRRLERGLPPREYEEWINNGGVLDMALTREIQHVTDTTFDITYIPKEKAKDHYIEKSREVNGIGWDDLISLGVGYVTEKRNLTILGKIWTCVEAIDILYSIGESIDLNDHYHAMNRGKGLLVFSTTITHPSNLINITYTNYISWNGYDEIHVFDRYIGG